MNCPLCQKELIRALEDYDAILSCPVNVPDDFITGHLSRRTHYAICPDLKYGYVVVYPIRVFWDVRRNETCFQEQEYEIIDGKREFKHFKSILNKPLMPIEDAIKFATKLIKLKAFI